MNLLLFDIKEVRESRLLILRDRRAEHLLATLRVRLGQRVKVGQIGGGIGAARVIELNPGEVTLELGALSAHEPLPSVDLLVALPRPQTLKKVLEAAATFGVGKLTLCGAAGVEKSFFQSRVLHPERISKHLQLGLEQAVATWFPHVAVFRSLEEALATVDTGYQLKTVAHPGDGDSLGSVWSEYDCLADSRLLVAIGPESGWSEREVGMLTEAGFKQCSLGSRILRVETAVTAVLANLTMLRSFECAPFGASPALQIGQPVRTGDRACVDDRIAVSRITN